MQKLKRKIYGDHKFDPNFLLCFSPALSTISLLPGFWGAIYYLNYELNINNNKQDSLATVLFVLFHNYAPL